MIGGLSKEEENETYKGTPFFGRIPLLGALLSEKTKTKTRAELLILITPHIISGDELTTGYTRDFGAKMDKEYQPYPAITEGSDLSAEPIQMRTYQEYPSFKKEEEQKLTIKPLRVSHDKY